MAQAVVSDVLRPLDHFARHHRFEQNVIGAADHRALERSCIGLINHHRDHGERVRSRIVHPNAAQEPEYLGIDIVGGDNEIVGMLLHRRAQPLGVMHATTGINSLLLEHGKHGGADRLTGLRDQDADVIQFHF